MKDFFPTLLFFSVFILEILLGSLSLQAFSKLTSSQVLSRFDSSIEPVNRRLVFPLLLFFLILSFNLSSLFPWMQTSLPSGFRHFYLNSWSFILRSLVYFCIWIFLSSRFSKRFGIKPAAILILVALSATFFSIDWILSLDPEFRSTSFGLIFFMSCALSAFAFHLCLLPKKTDPSQLQKLNNIHLALIGSWSYLVFIQFLVVWYGNIPAETGWYESRLKTSWFFIPVLMVIFQFSVPIFLLLFRWLKRSHAFSRNLAFTTLLMQALYSYWLIFPSPHPHGIHFSWGSAIGWAALIILFLSAYRRLHATA